MQQSKSVNTYHSSSNAGFTLIELLVSLTILGVILLVLNSALTLVNRSWSHTSDTVSNTDMILKAYELIRRDVEGIQRLVVEGDSDNSFVFQGRTDRLSFVVIEPPYPSQRGPFEVHYEVENLGINSRLLRARVPFSTSESQLASKLGRPVELIEGPLEIKISYLDLNSGIAIWRDRWIRKDQLPIMIKFDIRDRNQPALIPFTMKIPIKITAERQCTEFIRDLCTPAKTDRPIVRK